MIQHTGWYEPSGFIAPEWPIVRQRLVDDCIASAQRDHASAADLNTTPLMSSAQRLYVQAHAP
ncbi:MAG: hypothetical protein HYX44_00985 [Aquabacterium sp.]|nr:hypothetical protein [Aquabacterium sp.]